MHSVRRRPSKTVPRQTQAKFLFRDDQSYSLTINLKFFSLFSIVKCPKSRPENRAYFIKAAHRRNHSRVKLATRKMFAMMHLRKKSFQIFRNPDPDYIISGFLKFFEPFYDIDHSQSNTFLRYVIQPILERLVQKCCVKYFNKFL